MDQSYFFLNIATPVCLIDCREAWKCLTEQQKLFAHHLARASYLGSLIVSLQTSAEAPYIFTLLHKLFSSHSIEELKKFAMGTCEWTEDEFKQLLVYSAGLFSYHGNYRDFGDAKFVPEVSKEKLDCLIKHCTVYDSVDPMWKKWRGKMYSLEPYEEKLGFNVPAGTTTYHSATVSEKDTDFIKSFMVEQKMEAWNTRLFKYVDVSGKIIYEIRLASIETESDQNLHFEFEGCIVEVTRGDYSPLLKLVVKELSKANHFVANDKEKAMIDLLIRHFTTGNLDDHKNASRIWVQNKGPVIETIIGFIENYRDPAGSRSEFESTVAAVNLKMSKKYGELVKRAEELLKLLPWGKDYEKDVFLKPDFTSLDVITIGGKGVYAGKNVPNYDEIRQNEGFKNVALGNVISATPNVKVNFLTAEDQELFKKWKKDAIEVQVGCHELLGHGSGKLFQRQPGDGSLNFDIENVKHLLTGKPVTSWYEDGETWSSKFGALSNAYEECRAEAVGYFLSCFGEVLEIFGHCNENAAMVKYVNWLFELRAGLMALEFYSPEINRWSQAHAHARFVLLCVCIEGGDGFVKIEDCIGDDDGRPDLLFSMDKSKIDSVGKPAVFEFMKKLQVYKSTGDVENGSLLFEKYSQVTPQYLRWREIVIKRRQPRPIFVQCNTKLKEDGSVQLVDYSEDFEGIIRSWIERIPDVTILDSLIELADRDEPLFRRLDF